MPSTSATPVRSLRRGLREMDSFSRRINILYTQHETYSFSFRNLRTGGGNRGQAYDDIPVLNVRRKSNRIAAAGQTNLRNIYRRATIAADQRRTLLPIALRAANLASIERRGVLATRLAEHHEANQGVLHIHGIETDLDAIHRCNWHANDVADGDKPRRSRRRGRGARVNEFGGQRKNHHQAEKRCCCCPNAAAAMLMLAKALLRRIFGILYRRGAKREPFAKHNDRGNRQNHHKEKIFVADNRADDSHLAGARRQPSCFTHFVKASDG